jgi:hypothetical protein
MLTKKRSIIAVILILVIAVVVYFVKVNQTVAPTGVPENSIVQSQPEQPTVSSGIKYLGEEGKTALELLKKNYIVKTKEYSGLGEFVTSINGNEPDPNEYYWSFYVNGKPAQVGASQYSTRPGDEIEWKLEKVENFK